MIGEDRSRPRRYVDGRISDALWARKSAEWEPELVSVAAGFGALERPAATYAYPTRYALWRFQIENR
jgi:hypothetical protein